MVEFPDEIKSAYSNHLLIEAVNRFRFLQPHPSVSNTAKAVLVYRQLDEGVAKKSSAQIAYPGSPVLLHPGFVYVVRADIGTALLSDAPVADNVPHERQNLMILVSDDYRPVFGAENHLQMRTDDTGRLPPGGGITREFLRVPNPGARRIGFWFETTGTGNTVTAEVAARALPGGGFADQIVIAAPHPEQLFVTGTADFVPVDWEIRLTEAGVAPTSVTINFSFLEEA